MIKDMTPLEQAIWAHTYALEYHARYSNSDDDILNAAEDAVQVADCAVDGLREIQEELQEEDAPRPKE